MAENVVISYGHFEVDPSRMEKYVKQQTMNEPERERIIKSRLMYLDWMHDHFADKVVPPPGKVK